jgi:CheY-like chemotaxis protein
METVKAIATRHIVLYADDDADDLMLLQLAFDEYAANVEVVTAWDGKEALLYLESLSPADATPCLIILDVNMPRMNGKEALKAIRSMKRFEATPIVLFTTSSFLPDKALAEEYNAGFMTKPLEAKEMQAIAAQFVEHCSDEVKKNIQKKVC